MNLFGFEFGFEFATRPTFHKCSINSIHPKNIVHTVYSSGEEPEAFLKSKKIAASLRCDSND
jgi:hypothetical protein